MLALLVAVPLVFDTTVWPVFALPKFTLTAIGAVVALGLAVGEGVVSRTAGPWRTRLSLPVFLVVGWTAASAAGGSDVGRSLLGSRESWNGLAATVAFAVVFVTVARAFDASHVKLALGVLWFGTGSAVLLYGAAQLLPGWDPIRWVPFADLGAVWSTLGNPNDLGGFLAMILPVGIALLALVRRPFTRALASGLTVLLVVELVLTRSLGALTAGVVGALAVATFLGPRPLRTAAAVVAGVATLLGAGALAVVGTDDLLHTGEGSTVSLRLGLWETAWRMGVENPVLGVGPDGFAAAFDDHRSEEFDEVFGPELVATDAHNLLLTRLAEQGFPGAGALLALLAFAFVLFVRTGQRLAARPSAVTEYQHFVAICAALLAYVIQAMFNRQDIALDFCFWFLLGLGCALANRVRAREGSGRRALAGEGGQGEEDGDSSHR